MAVTMLTAAATTKDPLAAELKVSMRDAITFLDVDDSQFTTMLMDPRLSKEKASSFKEEWLEDQYVPRLTTLTGSITAASDTVINVATNTGYYFKAGDVVRVVESGEAILVTTGAAASTFTGTRAIGTVSSATAVSGGDVVIVSSSYAQGSTLPQILMTQRTTNYNYTQIHRLSYGFARTTLQTQWYGGSQIDKERSKKLVEFKRGIEHSLFFGPRYYTATGPQHTMGGLIEYVTTNINSAAGAFDKDELNTFLRAGLQYGNADGKVLFAAPVAVQVMANFLRDNWIHSGPDEKIWGAKISGVISAAFGGNQVPVISKRSWNNFQTGTTNHYGSRAFLVDMKNVQYLELQPTVQLRNRQAPDYDGTKEEYLAEYTMRVESEKSHALWTNITS